MNGPYRRLICSGLNCTFMSKLIPAGEKRLQISQAAASSAFHPITVRLRP